MPHVCDPREQAAEHPAAHAPEGVSRRMRHAKVVGGRGELSGILEADGGPERKEIDEKRSECRGPECRPVDLGEELLAGPGVKNLFVHGQ